MHMNLKYKIHVLDLTITLIKMKFKNKKAQLTFFILFGLLLISGVFFWYMIKEEKVQDEIDVTQVDLKSHPVKQFLDNCYHHHLNDLHLVVYISLLFLI